MICIKQQDKRLCFRAVCTATGFFGLSIAPNQKDKAHPSSKLHGITSKTKIERFVRESCPSSPRPVLRVFGRFAPQHAPELKS